MREAGTRATPGWHSLGEGGVSVGAHGERVRLVRGRGERVSSV